MKMIILALAVLTPKFARADESRLNLKVSNEWRQATPGIDVAQRYHSGEVMRDIGIPMTLVGAGLLGTSIYLFSRSNPCLSFYGDTCPPDNGYFEKAAITLLVSLPHLGLGIPLWAVGQHRMNQAQSWGYLPYAAPVPGGGIAGLTIVGF